MAVSRESLRQLIAEGEGTTNTEAISKGYTSGYDVTLGYGKYDPPTSKPISRMTLRELDEHQTRMLNNPNNKLNSSAAGRYQIVRKTRRELQKELGLSDDTVFTPEIQDRMADRLLERRGLTRFENGDITAEQLQTNLSKEWASLPDTNGRSYYGQRTGVSSDKLQTVINGGSPTGGTSGSYVSAEDGRKTNATKTKVDQTGTTTSPTSVNNKDVNENNTTTKKSTSKSAVIKQADDAIIAQAFLEPIETRENPFKKFASMTYSASIYLMPKEKYNEMLKSGQRSVQGLPLLIQSGGINNEQDKFGAVRAQNFDRDFYIDDIEMKGLVSGTSTQSVHNQYSMSFTITEPNGITFIDKLTAEAKKHFTDTVEDKRNITPVSQIYLLVIRFYGYDINGNIVDGNQISSEEILTDKYAFSEKFIPFMFTGISFAIEDSMVSYKCEAVCPMSHYGTATTHSTVPEAIYLQGNTLNDILSKSPNGKHLSLAEKLNDHWGKITKGSKLQQKANKYVIEFHDESKIGDSKITKFGTLNKALSGMGSRADSARIKKDTKAGTVDPSRMVIIPQGTSIIKVIEEVVRNSEFITNQQNIVIDQHGKPTVRDKSKNKYFNWFKIRMQSRPLEYDEQRRDYSQEIKYIVSLYGTGDIKSPVFPGSIYRGEHKRYPYWFTGENTEIIKLSQEYNYLYFQQITPKMPKDFKLPIVNAHAVERSYYSPKQNESQFGGDADQAELTGAAASILYSPADQAMIDVEIVGDPDWIAQSEIFYSPEKSLEVGGYGAWLPDKSVNFDSSEVYFSVEYNTPQDYNDEGLMAIRSDSPYKNISAPDGGAKTSLKLVYRANMVDSTFKNGKFTQRLQGTLMMWRDEEKEEEKEMPKESPNARQPAWNNDDVNMVDNTGTFNRRETIRQITANEIKFEDPAEILARRRAERSSKDR